MSEVKTKKRPKSYPDILAFQRCVRILEELPAETRRRVAHQIAEKVSVDVSEEIRKQFPPHGEARPSAPVQGGLAGY